MMRLSSLVAVLSMAIALSQEIVDCSLFSPWGPTAPLAPSSQAAIPNLPFDPLEVNKASGPIAEPVEETALSPEEAERIKKGIQLVDPEDFKRSFKKSKPNKVSSLLHYLHGLSNKSVYDTKQVDNVKAIVQQPDFRNMSDEEVLKSLCSQNWTSVCEKAARMAMEKKPQHVADIVESIRNKPAYVDANKLLWHKLFEKAISKVEDKNIDDKLNAVINTAATKNPYLFAASKIIDKTG